MPCLPNVIATVARSEMSRNALNKWEKFKLPQRDARIDTLLDTLRKTDSRTRHDRRPA